MSELDLQKERVGWYKDLFKWVLTIILTLGIGLAGLLVTAGVSLWFFIGIALLFTSGIYAVVLGQKVHEEIEKLRGL
jgi:fatty acid desaturase